MMFRKGIIFDMDGVITDTRKLHFQAWKSTFDRFLSSVGGQLPFTEQEYQNLVDGKTREDGICDFLRSRGILPSSHQVEELANEKNEMFLNLLRSSGSVIFEDVLRTLQKLKDQKISLSLITSSKNAQTILTREKLENFFDVVIDRTDAENLGLKGKPAPDYFFEAASRTGLMPHECAIVEDSVSGIQAGVVGGFHDVIGISREGQTPSEMLFKAGAGQVIHSLSELIEGEN